MVLSKSSGPSPTGTLLSCRLDSLLGFLCGPHAVHVRCVHLDVDTRAAGGAPHHEDYGDADSRALQMGCLAACSGLALQELHVQSSIKQLSLGYLPCLTSLSRLVLSTGPSTNEKPVLRLPELPAGIQCICRADIDLSVLCSEFCPA